MRPAVYEENWKPSSSGQLWQIWKEMWEKSSAERPLSTLLNDEGRNDSVAAIDVFNLVQLISLKCVL